MSFVCTILEARTEVRIVVARSKPSTPLETLRSQKFSFLRRYQSKISSYIKQLLMRKRFSFRPREIRSRAYRNGDEYRMTYNFTYEDARTTELQKIVRQDTRWKIISTEIQVFHDEKTEKTTLKVEIEIFKSLPPIRPRPLEVSEQRAPKSLSFLNNSS